MLHTATLPQNKANPLRGKPEPFQCLANQTAACKGVFYHSARGATLIPILEPVSPQKAVANFR